MRCGLHTPLSTGSSRPNRGRFFQVDLCKVESANVKTMLVEKGIDQGDGRNPLLSPSLCASTQSNKVIILHVSPRDLNVHLMTMQHERRLEGPMSTENGQLRRLDSIGRTQFVSENKLPPFSTLLCNLTPVRSRRSKSEAEVLSAIPRVTNPALATGDLASFSFWPPMLFSSVKFVK